MSDFATPVPDEKTAAPEQAIANPADVRQDVAALIAGARRPELEFPVATRTDLVAEYGRLSRRVQIARAAGGTSLAGPDLPDDVDEQLERLREEIQQTTIMVRMRALPKRRYRELKAAHAPRRDVDGTMLDEDRRLGVDPTTFFPALIPELAIAPSLTPGQWSTLLEDVMTDGDYEQLTTEAWNLNEESHRAPLSHAVSTKTPRSDSA